MEVSTSSSNEKDHTPTTSAKKEKPRVPCPHGTKCYKVVNITVLSSFFILYFCPSNSFLSHNSLRVSLLTNMGGGGLSKGQ